MNIPADGTLIMETPLCTFWMDKYEILHCISKNAPRNLENTKEQMSILKTELKNKKAFMLADFTEIGFIDSQSRDHIKNEADNFYGAIAFISRSPIGKVAGSIFSILMPPTIPTRLFTNENEAREWLIYCKNKIEAN